MRDRDRSGIPRSPGGSHSKAVSCMESGVEYWGGRLLLVQPLRERPKFAWGPGRVAQVEHMKPGCDVVTRRATRQIGSFQKSCYRGPGGPSQTWPCVATATVDSPSGRENVQGVRKSLFLVEFAPWVRVRSLMVL